MSGLYRTEELDLLLLLGFCRYDIDVICMLNSDQKKTNII